MKIDADRWERVQSLFHTALDLPEARRRAFLDTECTDEPELLSYVLTLLAEDERNTSLLDRGIARVAGEVLDGSVPHLDAVGPYRIVGVLGQGGMGVVYLGERADLRSRVAIKVLRDASLSPMRRERFASEQRMLAQLNHPAIARLYDADTLPDGTPYFIMEYVEGEPLTTYCDRHECTVAERLGLMRAVCEAVQYAHRHAIVHRDLKPSNILVTAEGKIKLLDFGISKHLESLDTPGNRTLTALRPMTPAYAAPELVRGQPVGIYTDVYALGVVLYELLAGRLPFDLSTKTPGQAEALIVQGEPERPSVVAHRALATPPPDSRPPSLANKRAWADLDVLCLSAMHKDVQRRYRTVDALARDVDHYLSGQPLEARPDSATYRAGKFMGRNWRSVTSVALVVAVIIGLVVFYTVRLAAARDAALAEAARTQRIQRFTLRLFEGGDTDVGPADTLRVVSLVERGVDEARVLDREPVVQAELFGTLGAIYEKLGQLQRADTLLQAALEQRRSLHGPDHRDVAESLVALGLLRVQQAEFDEAERFIREGLAMSRRQLPPDHPSVLEATVALGRVLQERGEYAQAIEVLENAAAIAARRSPASAELSHILMELANTHFYAGDYSASDSLNRVLLAMDRQIYGERHPYVADALINLGAVQAQLGNYDEAERIYRDGIQIMEAYYGPDHHRTAASITVLARALIYEEKTEEAEELLRRAVAIRERVFGSNHPTVASTVNELGSIAMQKHDYATAARHYQRVIDVYRAAYDDKHYVIGVAQSNLGTVYTRTGDYARAELTFREAIRRFGETLPADHMQPAITRIKLGRALIRQHKYAEAEGVILAGYEVLTKQANPALTFLNAARTDLVETYDALHQPAQSERFRREIAAVAGKAPGS
jgi:serine/threonine protein kinase/tetratricopeptide (TPR) repeat protein